MKKHTFFTHTNIVLWIWILQGVLLILAYTINPNRYTTVDSLYYLQGAQSILEGKGYMIMEGALWVWNGHFPPLYSCCIALVSFLTHLPVLISSKLVNWLSVGVLFMYYRQVVSRENLVVIALFFCSGICLKLWVHTWSEPLFIVLLLIFCDQLKRGIAKRYMALACLGIAIILTRYIGVFIIPVVVLYSVLYEKKALKYVVSLSAIWCSLLSGLLMMNKYFSGEMYGGPRFTQVSSWVDVLRETGMGFINELLLFRDITSKENVDLVILGIATQLYLIRKIASHIQKDFFTLHVSMIVGVVYVLFLTILRVYSPFGPIGYRLLAPFTILICVGEIIRYEPKKSDTPIDYGSITFLTIMSWIHLLPYSYQK